MAQQKLNMNQNQNKPMQQKPQQKQVQNQQKPQVQQKQQPKMQVQQKKPQVQQNNNQKPQNKPNNQPKQNNNSKPVQVQNKPAQKPQVQQNKQNNNQKPQQNKPAQKPQQNKPVQKSAQDNSSKNNSLMPKGKYVYFFGEGDTKDKKILGGKGANLGEMTKIGLPVPSGFTITTEVCDYYNKHKKTHPPELQKQIDANIIKLEQKMGMKFGDKSNPLLVSVRSGAALSMPGMMDTILNLGLNDETIQGVIARTKNERFAWDSYRRFIHMFGDVVMGVEHKLFEEAIHRKKESRKVKLDTDLSAQDLKELVNDYKAIVRKAKGRDFPANVKEQLIMSINAVFGSWDSPRAITYREINDIKGLLGTAVNVQAMVFGNMGNDSGTGVAFTRNPSTGENKFYGEYLINSQGEDVVAGIRTPEPVARLEKDMPVIYKQLIGIRETLEKHYKDMQDIEFTVQKGVLFMLQTRNGKRTGPAAVRMAVEMANDKLITRDEALLRVDPAQLDQLLHKRIDPVARKKFTALTKGLPASPGAAVGKIVFESEDAVLKVNKDKEKVILVRIETSADDIAGMHVAQGILTARGGMTSHAAVVARGMGKCCVAGCSDLEINEKAKTLTIKGTKLKEGDFLTLDGTSGEVFAGQLPVIDPELSGEFGTLMQWANAAKRLEVRANADTPKDAEVAKKFGAKGIGLCRTEHMFFEEGRILFMREMILAETEADRRKALNKLLPFQKQDFMGIFKVMSGLPVIIRFLDPPLHEFLPKGADEMASLAKMLKLPLEKVKAKADSLHEFNPMLGFRGCRLGVVYPEISEMQARAVFEAALEVKKQGFNPIPEIEIPNVIAVPEFKLIKDIVKRVAKETKAEGNIHYKIGTMLEFPRAILMADKLAEEAEFMSFGTNDLTQTTLGFSRDDAGRFIPAYVQNQVFEKDPFQVLDQEGVGYMMKIAITKARSVKKNMDMGICGEHGGESSSVKFCHKIGLSNVSCSPYRVPIAILAAAQAAVEAKSGKSANSTK